MTMSINARATLRANAPNGKPAGAALARVGVGFALALFMTAAPVLLHLIGQPLSILFCLIAAGGAVIYFEEHVPTIVLTAAIFQNLFVSLISPAYADFRDIEPIKSANFITALFIWGGEGVKFLRERRSYSRRVTRWIYVSLAVLAVVGVYFIGGLAKDGRSATIYMRNIGLPILMFQLFLVLGTKRRIALPTIVAGLLGLTMVCAYLELFETDAWLTATNGWTYQTLGSAARLVDMREIHENAREGLVITSVRDYASSQFLNLSLPGVFDFTITRILGPNMHPISFGYLLAIFAAFSVIDGMIAISVIAAPLLLATSAKGPIVLFCASVGAFWLARRIGAWRGFAALLLFLLSYSVFVILWGMQSGDYHVLGLLGGLKGFLAFPIGHTLGEGGNLSMSEFNVDWGKAQREGATDMAVESAVSVLFFQLGVMAAVVLAFYAWIAVSAWRLYAATGAPALAFAGGATIIILFNGLFQEEAFFSPLSLALLMALVGLILGSADRELAGRPKVLRQPSASRPARLNA